MKENELQLTSLEEKIKYNELRINKYLKTIKKLTCSEDENNTIIKELEEDIKGKDLTIKSLKHTLDLEISNNLAYVDDSFEVDRRFGESYFTFSDADKTIQQELLEAESMMGIEADKETE